MIITPNNGREEGLRVKVVTDAASEPVSTSDMKTYLKVDYSDDDTLIAELVKSARQMVEGYLGRKIGSQTLKAHWTAYPKLLRLPYAPIISVANVVKIDDNTSTTLTLNTDYFLLGDDDKYIQFGAKGSTALEVNYTAGYTTVPSPILTAIKRTVAKMYEFRGDDIEESPMDLVTRKLLSPYKVVSI